MDPFFTLKLAGKVAALVFARKVQRVNGLFQKGGHVQQLPLAAISTADSDNGPAYGTVGLFLVKPLGKASAAKHVTSRTLLGLIEDLQIHG
mgnify:CR=1 FL=1